MSQSTNFPFVLEAAGLLAALTNPNHLLVVERKINRLIGINEPRP
ncbi:hypothetical protein [Yersinia enterocolitica]